LHPFDLGLVDGEGAAVGDWARFWAIDFHVHTPGSEDAKAENFGSAEDIVAAAILAGLDAIVVTDHNTVDWCSQVTEAAAEKPLVVIPGVEISTTEGHLLALWEEGTDPALIEELLVRLGMGQADRGKLDIAAEVGFADAARMVQEANGLAIAAHAEKEKGLLKLSVKAHLRKTLLNDAMSAVEVVHDETILEVTRIIAGARTMAFVRGSDTWDKKKSCHALSGIGDRRTWIKASRPDLVGIRHALVDPSLRISLAEPAASPAYAVIESIEVAGGFLSGQRIDFSPDLNCLVGGTGTGKSLVLEAVRFALHQQVDRSSFPAIRDEVDSRMRKALMSGGAVILHVAADGKQYRIERVFNASNAAPARVFQRSGTEWPEVGIDPAVLCPIAAFSQGEILDYSREPVGRMTLVDASIDLDEINRRLDTAVEGLHANARKLIQAKDRVRSLKEEAGLESGLTEQVRRLTDLFTTEAVKEQSNWAEERTALGRAIGRIDQLDVPRVNLPDPAVAERVSANADLFASASAALTRLQTRVQGALAELDGAKNDASTEMGRLQSQWGGRFDQFKAELDAELEKIDPGASLTALRANLEQLQTRLTSVQASQRELEGSAKPDLAVLESDREALVSALHQARSERRGLRRARVEELNAKAAGFVKLDIPSEGDESDFRSALETIKVGSRVRDEFLNQLALRTHPLRFARSIWSQNLDEIVDAEHGIDMTSVAKLLANIDERDLWEELLEMQAIDRPDVLTIKLKKPDDHVYTSIEELAHGQRCTAILVILLADGSTPVVVDQPEDALHAPWIEEYLVDRLRSLRGTRQYIFATRSPGIVVSGDAEQIITMKATAGHGAVEAVGSLERHELNRLALDHLEGGPIPFHRRAQKLRVSVNK